MTVIYINNVSAEIRVMDSNQSVHTVTLYECIYFSVDKERYTPYTTFRGSFIIPQYYEEIISIRFIIDGVDVHYGSVDMAKMVFKNGNYRLDINSRSYTLALGLNQPKPEINSNVTLRNIIFSNVAVKNITYEGGTKAINYIYVLDNSTLWDAVVAYSIKAYGTYPFVYKTNEVRVNAPTSVISRDYYDNSLIEVYNGSTLSNLISDIHMRDTEGNYETYNLSDIYASARDIVRHKQIPLDKQWLDYTDIALTSRIDFAKRGTKFNGIKVLGYSGEELFDEFSYYLEDTSYTNCAIHKLNITGSNNVIYTTMYHYTDAY